MSALVPIMAVDETTANNWLRVWGAARQKDIYLICSVQLRLEWKCVSVDWSDQRRQWQSRSAANNKPQAYFSLVGAWASLCVRLCLCWDGIHITLFAVVCDTELDWARTFAFRSAINQSMIGTEFTITCTVHKLAIKYIVYRMDIGFLSQLHAVHRRNKYIVTNTRRTKSWPLKKTDFRLFFLCPLQLRARRDVH